MGLCLESRVETKRYFMSNILFFCCKLSLFPLVSKDENNLHYSLKACANVEHIKGFTRTDIFSSIFHPLYFPHTLSWNVTEE